MSTSNEKNQEKNKDVIELTLDSDSIKKDDPNEDLDFDDFTKTIDERIDLLFRPSDEVTVEPLKVADEENAEVAPLPGDAEDEVPLQEKDDGDIELGLDLGILQKQKPVTPEETKEESNLAGLLEKVHIAYLDLDWEFSKKNVHKLQENLKILKEESGVSSESGKLFQVAEGLLNIFLQDENAVSYASMNLLRETINLLLKIIQKSPTDDELATIDRIVRKFAKLADQFKIKHVDEKAPELADVVSEIEIPERKKTEIVAEKEEGVLESGVSESPEIAREELDLEKLEQLVSEEPAEISVDISRVITKTEEILSTLKQIYSGIEKENKLFSKIVDIFSQKPKLKQVATYLGRLQSNYEKYASHLRILERDIGKSLETLRNSLIIRDQDRVVDLVEEVTKPATEISEEVPEIFREVMVAQIGGHNIGIPYGNIVRVSSTTSKKMRAFISRGYLRLKDVKPFLKSIKYGILGQWRNMPTKVLKSLKFPIIDISRLSKEFRVYDDPGLFEWVVLLGSESAYGALPVDVIFPDTPEELKKYVPPKSEDSLWIEGFTDTGKKVKVLNVPELLK